MRKRRWSDDQLREAVAASRTWTAAIERLGLTPRGRNHRTVQRRVRELGLDARHLGARIEVCSDAALRVAVAASTSYAEVLDRLGLGRDAAIERVVQRRVQQLGLGTRHFVVRARAKGAGRTWSDEQLREAVRASASVRQAIRALGLVPAGGNYVAVQDRIAALALDTSHFKGLGWRRGLAMANRQPRPLADVLVAGSRASTHALKQRLFRAGLKQPACELCGWSARAPDGRIPVELDHRNGDATDNRLENLRVLCPNCHSLQPTHRGLNKRSRRAAGC